MPNNWKTYKLKEVCEKIFSGGTPSTSNPEFWNGEIPWLSSGETGNRYISGTEKFITEIGLQKSSAKMALKDDIVIASAGQGKTRGQTSFLKIDTSINQSVLCFRVDKEIIDSKFLFFNLSNRYDEFRNISDSFSTRGSLTKDLIENQIKLELPLIQEQKSIASILSAIDDKIENNLAINKTLEEMAMALYKNWFVDFGPFKDGEFVESELGSIPMGWEVKRLNEIAFKRAETYKFKGKEKVVFVNTGDVLEGSFMHKNYMDIEDLPGQAKKAIYPEDILYSEIRPGNKRYAYVDFDSQDYVVSTKFMVIRNNELINNKLLYRILTRDETITEFQNIAESRSGTFPQITFDAIGHIQFALPNIDKQNEFQSIVGNWEEQQANNLKENQALTQLRNTLLPKLISGEVRLNEYVSSDK